MFKFEIAQTNYERNFHTNLNGNLKRLMGNMKSMAELIREDIQNNILNKRAIPSGRIPANTPATERIKGIRNAPLINTGGLHDSISTRSIDDGYEIYIEGEDNLFKAKINSVDRMQYTIFGRAMKTPVKVPARKFFGIRNSLKKDLKRLLNG